MIGESLKKRPLKMNKKTKEKLIAGAEEARKVKKILCGKKNVPVKEHELDRLMRRVMSGKQHV